MWKWCLCIHKWRTNYHYYSYGVTAPSLIVLFSPPLTHSVGRISLNSNLALSQISKERGELLWGNYYYIYYILNTITIYTILLYILKVLYLSFLSSDKAFTTADMRFIEGEWKNTTVSDWGECTFAIPNIRQVNYSN